MTPGVAGIETYAAAVLAEVERAHPEWEADPWPPDAPYLPIGGPDKCERCGEVVVPLQHQESGTRGIVQIGVVTTFSDGRVRCTLPVHTPERCQAARDRLL